MRFRALTVGLLAAGCLLGNVSCLQGTKEKTTIAVVPKVDDASVAAAKAVALAASDTYDIQVRWDVSRNPTAESQIELIEKLVRDAADGILIS